MGRDATTAGDVQEQVDRGEERRHGVIDNINRELALPVEGGGGR